MGLETVTLGETECFLGLQFAKCELSHNYIKLNCISKYLLYRLLQKLIIIALCVNDIAGVYLCWGGNFLLSS